MFLPSQTLGLRVKNCTRAETRFESKANRRQASRGVTRGNDFQFKGHGGSHVTPDAVSDTCEEQKFEAGRRQRAKGGHSCHLHLCLSCPPGPHVAVPAQDPLAPDTVHHASAMYGAYSLPVWGVASPFYRERGHLWPRLPLSPLPLCPSWTMWRLVGAVLQLLLLPGRAPSGSIMWTPWPMLPCTAQPHPCSLGLMQFAQLTGMSTHRKVQHVTSSRSLSRPDTPVCWPISACGSVFR